MAAIQRIIVESQYSMFNKCISELTFERISPTDSSTHPHPALDYSVTKLTRIHRDHERFYIFRAQLMAADSSRSIDVILKTDVCERREILVHEASIYETGALKGLVPKYYGLFEVAEVLLDLDPTVSLRATCLVLEDCGDPMPGNGLGSLKPDFKQDAVLQMVKFHDAGFRHGKLQSDNFLHNRKGRTAPIIIDLEYTESHQCGRKIPIDIGGIVPSLFELGCAELLNLGSRTGIWLNEHVTFYGLPVGVWAIKSAEHLASLIHDCDVSPSVTKEVRLKSAQRVVHLLELQRHPMYNPDPHWQSGAEIEVQSAE